MPGQSFSIVVVCLGNVCRSPVAERLLRRDLDRLLGDRADAVHVSSAGMRAMVGDPVNALAAHELRRLGGDPTGFSARQLTGALATEADLVLVATRRLRSRMLEEAPRALKRAFTLRELAAIVAAPDFAASVPGSPVELVARAASWRATRRSRTTTSPTRWATRPRCTRRSPT